MVSHIISNNKKYIKKKDFIYRLSGGFKIMVLHIVSSIIISILVYGSIYCYLI